MTWTCPDCGEVFISFWRYLFHRLSLGRAKCV